MHMAQFGSSFPFLNGLFRQLIVWSCLFSRNRKSFSSFTLSLNQAKMTQMKLKHICSEQSVFQFLNRIVEKIAIHLVESRIFFVSHAKSKHKPIEYITKAKSEWNEPGGKQKVSTFHSNVCSLIYFPFWRDTFTWKAFCFRWCGWHIYLVAHTLEAKSQNLN